MKRLILILAALAMAAPASAQFRPDRPGRPDRDRASLTLYERPNFRGRSITFTDSVRNLASTGFNDRAGSARVNGRWRVCEDRDYRSRCEYLAGDVANLGALGMDRKVSSAARVDDWRPEPPRPGPGFPHPGPGPGPQPGGAPRLLLFSEPNFRGQQVEIYEPTTNLSSRGFNDRAMSARTIGRWQVCEDRDYGRRCETLYGDFGDLGILGMNRLITSARPIGR
ncbi:beta/gamma crystallin-related protein [Caulobacter sp. NIBR2454]|uniref:beta/gamma crystallin-related protein n=1 Tax=Caulobacter sp. NIBR2454 TaxID=3015996 RepID=UPI0022B5F9A3|nr:beta/gamma crystallin-related protein [Caulobacter sp. NIBR2454]